MRLLQAPSTILSLLAVFLAAAPASATPFSRLSDLVQQELQKLSQSQDDLSLQNSTLERRNTCAAGSFACGYYGQVCCVSGSQTCATNAQDQAYCAAAGAVGVTAAASGNGYWNYYTSTFVTTGYITMTTVYSSFVPTQVVATVAQPAATCTPNYANNESPCGPICCSSGQYCAASGSCAPAGNGGYTTTGVANSPPTRPTTLTNGVVSTVTISPTTTVPFSTPVLASGSAGNGTIVAGQTSGGLSGGAIAGIVIGVLAGIILLILLCLCCCLKAGFDGILALFGLGGKKKRTRVEEEYVESHRRYGAGSAAGGSRRWYGSAAGGRPGRPPPPEKKKGGLGGLGALGLGLGGLAVALGLKRKHDRKNEAKSDISSSYYDSYYYSESSRSNSRSRRDSRSRR